MLNTLRRGRALGTALTCTLLLATAALADSWVQPAPDGSLSFNDVSAAQAVRLDVLGYDQKGIQLSVDTPGFALFPYKRAEGEFVAVSWPGAAPCGEIGAPLLPVVRRLFVVPPDASVSVETALANTVVLNGTTLGFPLVIQPRQAPIEKLPGAIENAPFDFDPTAYAADAEYLAKSTSSLKVSRSTTTSS